MRLLVLAVCATPGFAGAQSPYRVDVPFDIAVGVGSFAGSALLYLVPVDEEARWQTEPFAFDEPAKQMFSARAAAVSDTTLAAAVVIPLAVHLGAGWNDATGEATLVYAEALGISLLLNSAAKSLVQRPRPYVYNEDPAIQRWAKLQGRESRLSFYSGHASTALTAAVAGSYLFAVRSSNRGARAVVWGVELALAVTAAGLRIRAGWHFVSDVLVGGMVGIALGVAVPYLHLENAGAYTPSAVEWGAIAGGVALGAAVATLLPFANEILWPLDEDESTLVLTPWANEHGAGLALLGTFE